MALGKSAFFGLEIDQRVQETLCDDICVWLKQRPVGGCFRHQSLNALKLPQAKRDPALFSALKDADCLSPDGMGVVWAARLLGFGIKERVTGIDLMASLLPRFAMSGTRVFLLGAKPDVVETLRENLVVRYPGLVIVGVHHGYDPDDDKLAEIVGKSGAEALFVALPSPRKELFVHNFAPKTGCRFAMGVGGAFDVMAGKLPRAPMVWQKYGMEFLWRIFCQPRYMVPRYGRGLAGFAKLTLPAILGYQARRLHQMVGRGFMIIALLGAVMSPSYDNRVWAATVVPPDVTDQQAMRDWIADRLSQVTTPDDLNRTIADILALVLPDEGLSQQTSGTTPDPTDWGGTEDAIEALLVVFETVLKMSGINSFLMEAVIGGVFGQLLDLHPDPDRIARLMVTTSPDLANTMFGTQQVSLIDDDLVSQAGFNTPPQATPISDETVSPDKTRFAQPFVYLNKAPETGFASEASSWGASETEERALKFVSEDASPR